jgi:excisionase family DNA binding protein
MVLSDEMMPMLTVKDVARILHIHVNTARRWSDQGILKSYRVSRRGDRRFQRKDIDLFLANLNTFKTQEQRGLEAIPAAVK